MFLNVPFDSRYSSLFIALVAGLTGMGRKPRCVLEVESSGPSRLERIFQLIAGCGASFHDLSRVTVSGSQRVPRFNMPFELGLAYSLFRSQGHRFFVLEERPFRLQASLSDLNGYDPYVHGSTQAGVLRCVLDCLSGPSTTPSLIQLTRLTRSLGLVARDLQRTQGVDTPFYPYIFRQIARAAAELASLDGLVR